MQTNGKAHMGLFLITPAQAADLLTRNKCNRKINRLGVNRLKRAIAAGEYEPTSDAIGIDSRGNLTNGQHRLTACVETDTPISTYVIYGLAENPHQDRGTQRTLAHVLSMHGVDKYANEIASAVKWYRLLRADINGATKSAAAMRAFTESDVIDTFESVPQIRDAVTDIMGRPVSYRAIVRPVALFAALRVILHGEDPITTSDLFESLATGDIPGPFRLLRDYLLTRKDQRSQGDKHELVTKVVRAFKAVRDGRDLKILRRSGGVLL